MPDLSFGIRCLELFWMLDVECWNFSKGSLLCAGYNGRFGDICILITKPMFVPVRVKAEVFEHLQIFLDGLIQGGEIVSDHEGAGAGHENEALGVAKIYGAATGDHDFLARQDKTETGNRLENLE